MKIHITAAEASGDLLGRELIEALRTRDPSLKLAGIGGAEMKAAGVESPIDIAPLSVLGLVEGLRAYSDVKRLVADAADAIIAFDPEIAVLIDSWGFTIRLADAVRARAPHIRLVKLIGPQVWATRPGRVKTVAQAYDHLLAMTEMEPPLYVSTGLPVTVIGAPALSRTQPGDGPAFCAAHGIPLDVPLVLVLPGSRASEIKRVAPVLVDAALEVRTQVPDAELVAIPAASVADDFRARFGATPGLRIIDAGEDRYDAMAAATLALACSGTVTSELAVQRRPMIVGYKVGWITWAIARFLLYRHTHITLLNIAAGDTEIVPEFVQTRFTPERLAGAAIALLKDPAAAAAQIAAQDDALGLMGYGEAPAAELAADAILALPVSSA
ncbi:MAG: lipid-A-disaccharide synthase [Pseudomonadota bacterium]